VIATIRPRIARTVVWDVVSEETNATNEPPPEGFRQHRFTPPPGATTVLLVRHGESRPAHPDRPFRLVDGHGDPELDPVGVQQAELLAERLAREPIAAIYVTNLCRTHQTAAPLAQRLGITPTVETDLREVFLGEWEGGEFRIRAVAGDPVFQKIFAEERWDVIPGAEPHDAFDERVWRGFQRIVAAHPDQTVMAVSHGGVIGQLLHRVTGARRFAFAGADNASISEIVASRERIVLRRYNDVAHLLPLLDSDATDASAPTSVS
jgi:2,3-bisphosphoglycerate-dependent phosphoglycerate mutase